jgi:drug/metabolite transporter (DMT)-like permease
LVRRALHGAPLIRSLAEIGAAVSMLSVLPLVPYTIITLVMQAMPFIVTLGAVLFFGEKVGWRRWTAIGVGFAGVALILRPGADGFSSLWLLALLVAFCLSARDLASRGVPRDLSTLQIATWGGIATFLAGLVLQVVSGDPWPAFRPQHILPLGAIVVLLSGGVFTVSTAMRMGDVSAVAPFRYTRLPFGLLIGVVMFGETVDASMIAGAAVIVGSGLFIFLREGRR